MWVSFSKTHYIGLEKRFVKPELFKGNFIQHEKDSFLEDVYEMDGTILYKPVGMPAGHTYGKDVNHLSQSMIVG
jgi:hypothetical protein